MAVLLCVACAAGNCDGCRGQVTRGRVTGRCSCRHDGSGTGGRIAGVDDPRRAGGSIAAVHSGKGGALLDTRRAVIVDHAEVCEVENPSDGARVIALFLEGRLNRSKERAAILHLLGPDGAAALVSQLTGLAARMGADFEAEFRAALDDRMNTADLWPTVPAGAGS